MMKKQILWMFAATLTFCGASLGFVACGLDMPKETKTSFETMTVEKQDITVPIKFSARLKGPLPEWRGVLSPPLKREERKGKG